MLCEQEDIWWFLMMSSQQFHVSCCRVSWHGKIERLRLFWTRDTDMEQHLLSFFSLNLSLSLSLSLYKVLAALGICQAFNSLWEGPRYI